MSTSEPAAAADFSRCHDSSPQGDVKALQGRDGYRLRIGNYRVIFDLDLATLAIYIGRRATTTYKRS